jgi:hypothetical protein
MSIPIILATYHELQSGLQKGCCELVSGDRSSYDSAHFSYWEQELLILVAAALASDETGWLRLC